MTQKKRILELLSNGEWHSCRELNNICFRYSARMHDLRSDGNRFEERHTGSFWEWRLKPSIYVEQELPMEVNHVST